MAVSGGWTDGKREAGESRAPRAVPRSLKDALSEAGLGDAPAASREAVRRREPAAAAIRSALRRGGEQDSSAREDPPLPAQPAAKPLVLVEEVPSLISSASRPEAAHGVVSPPPWLRAARRGRWQARFMNAFGWLVTIMVVGSIISVAGRYLAVAPISESIYTARQ